jgi:OFA family oxalate/formate antiporter-like MFS transporter
MGDTGEQKLMNRWLVVVGAVLIQLCLGAIYAWSVFTPALATQSPADVASVYGASKLGLDDARLTAMREELNPLSAELSSATKAFQKARSEAKDDATLGAAKTTFDTQKKTVLGKMDAIATKYGVKEKVDALTFGFSKTETQMVFAAGLALFAIVMVLAGRMLPKVGPRALAIAGGVVLGLGYVLAGVLNPGAFMVTFILVGIVGGAGIGLGYVVPIAVAMKWFPDKKGLVAGLAVAGFGFGALLWVKLAGKVTTIGWTGLIANLGLDTTFIIYGIAFAAMCIIGAIWMKNPPAGYKPEGWEPPAASIGGKPAAGSVDFTSGQMLATPQFYMIFLCFVFGAGAGLMSIGLMKLFPKQALEAGGLSAIEASAVAGTAMAVFFSLANGIGRIVWGKLADAMGPKASIFIMLATQGVLVICFQWMAGSEYMLYLGATLIGFNFGGNFALFPTITADTFGTKYIGQNYPWVFLSYGVGGIAGPIMGGKLGDLGNFPLAFSICGGLVLAGAVLILMVKHPHAGAAVESPESPESELAGPAGSAAAVAAEQEKPDASSQSNE